MAQILFGDIFGLTPEEEDFSRNGKPVPLSAVEVKPWAGSPGAPDRTNPRCTHAVLVDMKTPGHRQVICYNMSLESAVARARRLLGPSWRPYYGYAWVEVLP